MTNEISAEMYAELDRDFGEIGHSIDLLVKKLIDKCGKHKINKYTSSLRKSNASMMKVRERINVDAVDEGKSLRELPRDYNR